MTNDTTKGDYAMDIDAARVLQSEAVGAITGALDKLAEARHAVGHALNESLRFNDRVDSGTYLARVEAIRDIEGALRIAQQNLRSLTGGER